MNIKQSFCKVLEAFTYPVKSRREIIVRPRALFLIGLVNILFFMSTVKLLIKNPTVKHSSDGNIVLLLMLAPAVLYLLIFRRWIKFYEKNFRKARHSKIYPVDYKVFFIILVAYYVFTTLIWMAIRST
jgi:hypothetical protein